MIHKSHTTIGGLCKWGLHWKNGMKDLNEPVKQVSLSTAREKVTDSIGHELLCPPPPRFNNTKVFYPMTVALSQSAPGLECACQKVPFVRGHGCIMKTVRLFY